MSSFYGGKQGRTYHIVQRYDSVADMLAAFSQGGAYTRANYGQYVIIDTVLHFNKRDDPENGLLYRRGFDYNDPVTNYKKPTQNDKDENNQYKYRDINGNLIQEKWQNAWSNWITHPGAGAIYVGQIVGPKGESPDFTPVAWETLEEIETEEGRKITRVIPLSNTMGNDDSIVYDENGEQLFSDIQHTRPVWYGDLIKVGTSTYRDQTTGNITEIKLAFDIPTNVFEPEIVNTDPYSSANVVEDSDSINHPFYYKWNFTIPAGKKGVSLEEINIKKGEDINSSFNKDGFNNNIQKNDYYFTYNKRDYDQDEEGELIEDLGRWPYRVIDKISLINDTRQIITLEPQKEVKIGDLYRSNDYLKDCYWVCIKSGIIENSDFSLEDISFEDEIGTIIDVQETSWRAVKIPEDTPSHSILINYTAGQDEKFEKSLRSLDHFSVDTQGNLYAFYSDNLNYPYYITNIGGLKSIELDDIEGIIFNYQNGTPVSYPLKQIFSIDFYIKPPKKDKTGRPIYDLTAAQDSNLKIRYKDGTTTAFEIKRIKEITYNNQDFTQEQYIQVLYQPNELRNVSNEPINLVVGIKKKGDNILILYSDPTTREHIQNNGVEGKDWVKIDWKDPVSGKQYIGQNALVWKNFGPLGAQYHIQGQYHYADLKGDISYSDYDANTYLNLSNGFTGDLIDRMGWLVTVTDNENNKHLYAYDYNGKTHMIGNPGDKFSSSWYEIMSLEASMIDPKNFIEISQYSEQEKDQPSNMLHGGVWFIQSYGHDDF